MNSDFRVTVDALDHPKIVKLHRLTGDAGVLCLFRLWGFTARYHPRGDLNGMTDEDVEVAAKWAGAPGVFFHALVKLHLLDEMLGAYSVHDWEEHNGYAFHAPERSARSKHAAQVRWGCPEQCSEHAARNAPSPIPNPTPDPDPDPEKKQILPSKGDGGMSQDFLKVQDPEGAKKGKPYVPIEDREAKTDVSKLVRRWHRDYLAKTGIKYTGDAKKMGGQAATLLKRNSLNDLLLGLTFLLDQPQTQYVRHTWDHFVTRCSFYIEEGRKVYRMEK